MQAREAEYDVIVIGARIAGSIVSSLLADREHRVLVLDRATFPSDTISTHFFRGPALRAFARMGVFDEVEAAAPHLTVNYNVIDGAVFPEPVDRPQDYPFYMNVRRITLDDILARRVRQTSSVELREGAVATELLSEDDRVVGVAWNQRGQEHQAHAKIVVGADGVRSFVAKEVGAQTEHEEPVHRAMYYAYFRGVEPNEGPAAEFHYVGNTVGYCMPCDDGLTLMAASVPIDTFPDFKRDPEGNLMRELESMTALAPRLSSAQREGSVLGSSSIPCYRRIPYGKGWALVGDASLVMDPWSGQGIDHGSTHAVMLAERLGEYLEGRSDWGAAMKAYHQKRNQFSEKGYQRTSKYSADLRPMTRAALEKRGLS